MQAISAYARGQRVELLLPGAQEEVVFGSRWGAAEDLFSPAYWKAQCWILRVQEVASHRHSLGQSLRHEATACLLGSHGVPAEVALAAYKRLEATGLLDCTPSRRAVYRELARPHRVGNRLRRFRFARQRSVQVSALLSRLATSVPVESDHLQFREWFLALPGFGLKTASWVTRNWLDSDAVAILDVHVQRAGILAGIFSLGDDVRRDYVRMESTFKDFAQAIGERASFLDHVIWTQMRTLSAVGRQYVVALQGA